MIIFDEHEKVLLTDELEMIKFIDEIEMICQFDENEMTQFQHENEQTLFIHENEMIQLHEIEIQRKSLFLIEMLKILQLKKVGENFSNINEMEVYQNKHYLPSQYCFILKNK